MKLTVKTLQQKTFTIESQEQDTVLDLKKKIQESQGFSFELQKLIHSGKILTDDSLVKDLNIQEKDFLVVMVTKPKAAAQSSAPAASSVPSATVPAAAEVAAPAQVPVPSPADTNQSAPTQPTAVAGDIALATGSVYEAAVTGLVEMGFERAQVIRAMRAAFNNPDRAAEYLMTGIPESVARDIPAAQPANPVATQESQGTANTAGQPFNMFDAGANQSRNTTNPANPVAEQGAAAQLAMLRNSPQFQQLRQLVQAQPELLQPLLQQLAQSSPEMMQLISSNQDQFLSLLGEGAEGGEFEDEESAGPGGQFITISAEDDAAINRLVALGFDRNAAAEAFLACDKNEELAANYLFDSMGNDNW